MAESITIPAIAIPVPLLIFILPVDYCVVYLVVSMISMRRFPILSSRLRLV